MGDIGEPVKHIEFEPFGVGDMALEPWPEPPTWMRKVAFDTGTGYPTNFIVDERRGRPALVYSEARMPRRREASR